MAIPIPTLDENGIHVPSLDDILAGMQDLWRGIYGSDIVLTDDSQDGQLCAALSQAYSDICQWGQSIHDQFSPSYAQGVGLSSLVKINGLARDVATNSTCLVTLVGQTGTGISGGIVQDGNGNKWDLPALVTIPLSGTIDVTVTAQEVGALQAPIGTITKIVTPTPGWQSVTNGVAATAGAPVESDAALRNRQARSTANPAQAIVESIAAAVGNVSGVQRFDVHENATGATDADGVPAHSIAVVVEGGVAQDIGDAIASRKPPGIQTFGTTTVTVADQRGINSSINFYILTDVTLSITVNLKALPGYLSTTGDLIKAALVAFVDGFDVGEDSVGSRLMGPANLFGDAATQSSGMTQAQLDVLAKTYYVQSITQTRSGTNPSDTVVTGGPYAATSTAIGVASANDIYPGQKVRFVLDDASNFDVEVESIGGSIVHTVKGVPASRNIPNGSVVKLLSDLRILFNEAAVTDAAHITLAVT